MEIKMADKSQVVGIVKIWIEFIDFHKEIDPFFTRRQDGHINFEKFVRYLLESEDSLVLVALDNEQVVGYSIAEIKEYPPAFLTEKHGFISDMAVKSDYRRKGAGQLLLNEVLKWFDSKKVNRIELHVTSKNKIGYSFWKKHGFRDYKHILYLNM